MPMKKQLKISDKPVTSAASFSIGNDFAERNETVFERVQKWYIEPLRRMKGSEGFLVLLVLCPLYEKHLRNFYHFDGRFTEGHRIFRVIGKHLKLSENDAFQFWTHVRNGLLHLAAPKNSPRFDYGIREDGPPVEIIDDRFWINPFELRNRLLEEIVPDTRSWKTDEVPLARTYDCIKR